MLDEHWFGDFSTYSLSSLAEYLSVFFQVAVNRSRTYDRELLEAVDCLVIKVPRNDIPASERRAILDYVYGGGRLLLVGDHTALAGSSFRMNHLAGPAGMEFNVDALHSLSGGFVSGVAGASLAAPRRLGRHHEFMTGCSIKLHAGSRPLLTLFAARNGHDYAQNSYFTRIYHDPRYGAQPCCHCGIGAYGQGLICCLSDSTILSSFAISRHERKEWLRDLIAHLAFTGWATPWLRVLAGVVGFVLLGLALRFLRNSRRNALYTMILTCIAGSLLVDGCNRLTETRLVEGKQGLLSATVKHNKIAAFFPPSLGVSVPQKALGFAYDTWLTAFLRCGVFPSLEGSVDKEQDADMTVFLNREKALSDNEMTAMRAYVEGGGSLWILCRGGRFVAGAYDTLIEQFGFEVGRVRTPKGRLLVELRHGERVKTYCRELESRRMQRGRGRVVVTVGSQTLSRSEMGHVFAYPDRRTERIYRTFYEIMKTLVDVESERNRFWILE